ncbi:MAG: hypothetical protein KDK54_14540, partial [Leptospiraceae bacterium]|nr:hypothetical protein [Leptospiraceae bacterium]
ARGHRNILCDRNFKTTYKLYIDYLRSVSDSRFLPESFKQKEPCITIELQDGKLNIRRPRVSGNMKKILRSEEDAPCNENIFHPSTLREPQDDTSSMQGKYPSIRKRCSMQWKRID